MSLSLLYFKTVVVRSRFLILHLCVAALFSFFTVRQLFYVNAERDNKLLLHPHVAKALDPPLFKNEHTQSCLRFRSRMVFFFSPSGSTTAYVTTKAYHAQFSRLLTTPCNQEKRTLLSHWMMMITSMSTSASLASKFYRTWFAVEGVIRAHVTMTCAILCVSPTGHHATLPT